MTDTEWFKNRLTLLLGQYSLLMGATAMVQNKTIQRNVSWLEQDDTNDIDRIKLGGIVRAQPFGHRFEKDDAGHRYHQYYVACWSSLKLSDRKDQYEKLRNWRAEQKGGLDGLKSLSLTRSTTWYNTIPGQIVWGASDGGGDGFAFVGGGVGGEDGSASDDDPNGDSHYNLLDLDISARTAIDSGYGGGNGHGGGDGGGS